MDEIKSKNAPAEGLYVTGTLVMDPKYYPARVDQKTGEQRPESMMVAISYGQADNLKLYLPPVMVAGKHKSDTVTIGPLRVGAKGGVFLVKD